jgi:hypothetical protein
MLFLKIFLAGIVVLVVAVILNLLANLFHLATWYTFLARISELGFAAALQSLKVFDLLFLAVLYPFLLGLAAYLVISRF